ncbi:MAG: small ribosomal subunit Rsm22 family protein, partial [Butyrivibrio sp.]|nr:small ribosomal subunit Rsm22 family protein [Butyrivibrio sp.]
KSGGSKRVMTIGEAAVYSAVRMPATFGAVGAALGYALECARDTLESVIDVGAGTGAAALAAAELIFPKRIICLEREEAMRTVGKELCAAYGGAAARAEWKCFDITSSGLEESADLVLSSYMLNELSFDAIAAAVDKMWSAAGKMLLLAEPGTPAGYEVMRAVRERLIALGAHIAAPCPHVGECPASADDWCHFTCRVARSRQHKLLKGGDAPYEDEKFTYIAASKKPCAPASARVMRRPRAEKGRVFLRLCTDKGFEDRLVTAREKDALKAAKKAGWGGGYNY